VLTKATTNHPLHENMQYRFIGSPATHLAR
jgi:hypothetical protein